MQLKTNKPKETKEKFEFQTPTWLSNDIIIPLESHTASTFLVHGNIEDLQPSPDVQESYIPIREFLEKVLDNYKFVVFYNIASGMTFPTEDFEKEFRKAAGLDVDPDKSKAGPSPSVIAAAKAVLNIKKNTLPQDPETCLQLIEKVLRTKKQVAIVVDSVHSLAPAFDGAALPQMERAIIERFKNWARSENIKQNGNVILLFTNELSKVSSELRQGDNRLKLVYLPKPSFEER